jgi:hypothetical protein
VRISAKFASKCNRNDLTRQTDGQLVGYAGNDQSDFYGCSQFVCNQTKFDIKSIESVIRFPIESEDFGYNPLMKIKSRKRELMSKVHAF